MNQLDNTVYPTAFSFASETKGSSIDMNIFRGIPQSQGQSNRFTCDILNRCKRLRNRYGNTIVGILGGKSCMGWRDISLGRAL